MLVLDACRKRVKVGVRGRSSILDDFEFVASLLSWQARHFDGVRSLSLWRSARFVENGEANPLRASDRSNRSRCGAVRILSAPGCRFRGKRVTLTQRDCSRCGAVRILSMRSEPSGQVKSLSLWRGAHFEHAK